MKFRAVPTSTASVGAHQHRQQLSLQVQRGFFWAEGVNGWVNKKNGGYTTHMLHGAGIFTNICPLNHPNVGKYTIHGAYGPVNYHLKIGNMLINHEQI